MSSKRHQILCQKCSDLKNKKAVKFRAKDNGKEKTKEHESRADAMKQRKRSKTTWKKLSATKHNSVRSSSKPELCQTRCKPLSSPYESACEADDYRCPVIKGTPLKSGILKRRASSAGTVSCLRTTNPDASPFGIHSGRTGEEEEDELDPGKSETYSLSIQETFEEKRPKKIRFKIPEGTFGYEDAKKAMWRSREEEPRRKELNRFLGIKGLPMRYPTTVRCSSLGSPSESIREIMPVLERLKKDDDLIESELDLNEIAVYIREENEKARKGEKIDSEDDMESEEEDRESAEGESDGETVMNASEDDVQVKTSSTDNRSGRR